MADEAKKEEKKEKKGLNLKVIFIGLPLFIVQLVLVYFITATFLVKSSSNAHSKSDSKDSEHVEEESGDEEGDSTNEGSQQIFSIEDLIINPAGTNGQRLLLLSVGFGVNGEENLNMLKENEVVVKDLVINTLAQKTLSTLSNFNQKDSLKIELAEKVNEAYPKAKVKNVYFSKYLIN